MANVAAFLGRGNITLNFLGRRLREFLSPSIRAVLKTSGDDTRHLAHGLACSELVRVQRMIVPEVFDFRARLNGKYAKEGTVLGATAAILFSFWLATRVCKPNEPEIQQLNSAGALHLLLDEHYKRLCAWKIRSSFHLEDEVEASLMAERRCINRAMCAVKVVWEEWKLTPAEKQCSHFVSLKKQVEKAMLAAWPSGKEIGSETQVDLLAEIVENSLKT